MIAKTFSLYKTSFTGLSKEAWLLSFIMLVNRSGTMVLPFMTLYLTSKDIGRTLSEAGTVVSLWGIGAVIGAFFGKHLQVMVFAVLSYNLICKLHRWDSKILVFSFKWTSI